MFSRDTLHSHVKYFYVNWNTKFKKKKKEKKKDNTNLSDTIFPIYVESWKLLPFAIYFKGHLFFIYFLICYLKGIRETVN